MRGDLHMHTTETDGRATLEEMAEAARARGLEYIAITDHSKAIAMSLGLDEARVEAFAERVREINASGHLGIHVLAGIECDILRDGTLDLAWDALAQLDFVIGSVHSSQNLEANEMTDRYLRALECPYLRLLGHPTGRLLLHRDPFPFDFDRVVAEAVRRGVALEINASPERLDLSGHLVRMGESQRRAVLYRHGCAPSQTSGEFALRRADRAARMAGARRCSERASAGGFPEGHRAGVRIASEMKLTSTKEVYRCKLFWVTEDEAEESGFQMHRSVVRHRGSAVMMAVDEKKRVLLVQQFRLPAGKKMWELPAGKVDEGETVLQAAKRELIEETGYRAKSWKKLVSYFPSPGYVEEKMTIFLATELTEGRSAAHGR